MKDQGAHRLSRRTILIGLAGLAGVTAAGGAIAWLKLAGSTSAQSNHPQPTAPQGVIVTTPLLTYRGHHAPVTAVAWHDTRIASGGGDHTVQVWNANTGAPLLTYSGHTDIVTALSWSPDGRKIVVGAAHTGFIQVWDASTGATLLTYRGHQQKTGDTSITDVAWSPNGQWIASSSLDDSVQIWDSATGAALLTYRTDPPAAMGTAEWSPDSTRIAASGMAGAVHIFAASTGTTLGVLPGNGSPTIASQ